MRIIFDHPSNNQICDTSTQSSCFHQADDYDDIFYNHDSKYLPIPFLKLFSCFFHRHGMLPTHVHTAVRNNPNNSLIMCDVVNHVVNPHVPRLVKPSTHNVINIYITIKTGKCIDINCDKLTKLEGNLIQIT